MAVNSNQLPPHSPSPSPSPPTISPATTSPDHCSEILTFCPDCGTKAIGKFCHGCGRNLTSTTPTKRASSPSSQSPPPIQLVYAGSWSPPRRVLHFSSPRRCTIDEQGRLCFGCGKPLTVTESGFPSEHVRFCEYTQRYFCDSCHLVRYCLQLHDCFRTKECRFLLMYFVGITTSTQVSSLLIKCRAEVNFSVLQCPSSPEHF